jgi:isocitrate/isopropylmalate dehydrogenase
MMLEWFDTEDTRAGAGMIRTAVSTVFADPAARTRDMGGGLTTGQITGLIRSALPVRPKEAAAR